MCSQRFDPVIDEYVFCKLQARGKKLIVIKAIIGNQQAIKAIFAIKNSAFSPLPAPYFH
jgi:hypothetical protein